MNAAHDQSRHAFACAGIVILGVLVGVVGGCTSPGDRLGPLPPPVLSTRAPEYVQPAPLRVRPRVRPRAYPLTPDLSSATIVIDAGHGGKDPGAVGVGPQNEKTVNLRVSRALAARLRSLGATIISSRTTDRFLSLDARADLAERSRADLFISIHSDAARRSSASGATVYIARGARPESRQAATAIGRALERNGVQCRGVREAGFRVLVGHTRPAVLVECGFLTNPAEARRLAQPGYQGLLATAIAEGVAEYFGGR